MTKPGWTQIPNYILDNMANMSGSVFQICCVVARQTVGYETTHGSRKEWDRISISQFMDKTGLSNRSVIDAVSQAIQDGWIEREKVGQWYIYRLKPMKKVHNFGDETYEESSQLDHQTYEESSQVYVNGYEKSSQVSTQSYEESSQEPMKKVHTQKKERKNNTTFSNSTEQQELFEAVCKCVGWDYRTITQNQRGQVAQTIGILAKAGYTIKDLRRFYKFWFETDWRGQKGQHPTIAQLRSDIGKINAKAESEPEILSVSIAEGDDY